MAVFHRKLIIVIFSLSSIFSHQLLGETVAPIFTALPIGEVVIYPAAAATATVISLDETTISSQLTALVKTVHYQVGDRVDMGDILISLDCEDYQLAKKIAEAQKDSSAASERLALSQRNRSNQLLGQKLTSQQEADDREASYIKAAANNRLAQATLEQARLNVSRCEVKAPFSGVITERYGSKGQLTTPGTPLFRLVSPTNLEVRAEVSEQDAPQLADDTATVFESLDNYQVKLARTVSAIDQSTRTQEFRFIFTGELPLPGTAGKIKWRTPVPHLPSDYILTYQGVSGFFTVESDKARFQPLAGAFPGKAHPVSLPLDTLILKPPLGNLEDGSPVNILQSESRP